MGATGKVGAAARPICLVLLGDTNQDCCFPGLQSALDSGLYSRVYRSKRSRGHANRRRAWSTILRLLDSKKSAGKTRMIKTVGNATVNRALSTLRLMFNYAERCGFQLSNPVKGGLSFSMKAAAECGSFHSRKKLLIWQRPASR